jgi:hypothetical protein
VLVLDASIAGSSPVGAIAKASTRALNLIHMARAARRLLLMLRLIVPGCVTTTGAAGSEAVACAAFELIRWSAKNTDETTWRAKEHNAARKEICRT